MSSERLFKPKKEQIEKYKPYTDESVRSNEWYLKAIEIEIIVDCMSDNANVETQQLFKNIMSHLKMYEMCVRSMAQYNIYSWYNEEKDGVLCVYGGPERFFDEDIRRITYDIAKDLVMFSKLVKCDDYFKENSNYFEIKNEIEDKLEYIKDVYYDSELSNIMDELKDCELTDNDFDDFGNLKCSENKDGDSGDMFETLD